ncbi:MAG: hypothetical protein ABIJ25_11520 [Pseudomonadota bacterium]
MKAAVVAPTPGRIPIAVPRTAERRISPLQPQEFTDLRELRRNRDTDMFPAQPLSLLRLGQDLTDGEGADDRSDEVDPPQDISIPLSSEFL